MASAPSPSHLGKRSATPTTAADAKAARTDDTYCILFHMANLVVLAQQSAVDDAIASVDECDEYVQFVTIIAEECEATYAHVALLRLVMAPETLLCRRVDRPRRAFDVTVDGVNYKALTDDDQHGPDSDLYKVFLHMRVFGIDSILNARTALVYEDEWTPNIQQGMANDREQKLLYSCMAFHYFADLCIDRSFRREDGVLPDAFNVTRDVAFPVTLAASVQVFASD